MAQYGWTECPGNIRPQVNDLLNAFRTVLGGDLIGVYLHGSLAMGCFNPEWSDVDLLAITQIRMRVETKRDIAEILLRCSAAPAPIELSFLLKQDIDSWRYPTPYDFHYSEDWREKIKGELSDGGWRSWNEELRTDPDLAAHITIIFNRGICLYGPPIGEIFHPIPKQHYIASIIEDFKWGRDRIDQYPRSFILNACRAHAYLLEDRICSKDEAGTWAIQILAEEFKDIVAQALEEYRGDCKEEQFDLSLLRRLAEHMAEQIEPLTNQLGD